MLVGPVKVVLDLWPTKKTDLSIGSGLVPAENIGTLQRKEGDAAGCKCKNPDTVNPKPLS